MYNRKELLTVGEMAKLSGVSIRALHYYERKNILKPAFVDPDTGYRYYTYNQTTFASMIRNLVEFDIPLKEFARVVETDDKDTLKEFLEQSIKTMERKSKLLNAAIQGFEYTLKKMDNQKSYEVGKIYQRQYEEKNYYVKLLGPTITEPFESFLIEMTYDLFGKKTISVEDVDNFEDLVPLPEVGYYSIHSPEEENFYGFYEVASSLKHKNIITIPAGFYYFRRSEKSRIEHAKEIFKEQLKGADSYKIVEAEELFLDGSKVSQVLYELRLIVRYCV